MMDNGCRFLRKVIEEVKSMSSDDYNSFFERAQNYNEPQISYDKISDVLYISFGNPQPGLSDETDDGNLVRIDPYTGEIVGITILDFKEHYRLLLKTFPPAPRITKNSYICFYIYHTPERITDNGEVITCKYNR